MAILNEMIHDARIVPLDGRPRLAIPQKHGDSRGRWEGNTLVVETTSFAHETSLAGSSANMRLVERFTRIDSLAGVLAGARADEKAAEKAKDPR